MTSRQVAWRLFHSVVTRKRYADRLQRFREMARAPMSQVEETQRETLATLLERAWRDVPYYRAILTTAGAVVGGRAQLDRFAEIPPLDKSTLRDQLPRLLATNANAGDISWNASGGSTGVPVRLAQSREYHEWGFAGALFLDEWSGYKFGERKVILWGSERDVEHGRERPWVRAGRYVRNERWLNAFRMRPRDMAQFIDAINEEKPVQLLAYAESVYDLARFAKKTGRRVFSPRAVMTSAGTLYPYMRREIEEVFQTPVFDRYGSREVGAIAGQCAATDGLHVMSPTTFVEVAKPDGTAAGIEEPGEVLVTLLTNHAMPLIRYRIGDVAAWQAGTCDCGCAWPRLARVLGRTSDTFVTPDGTRVHGEYFTHLLYFRDWVEKFQIIQEEPDLVRFRIVADVDEAREKREAELAEIATGVQRVMGAGCRISWEFVSDIEPAASGKHRFTISNVGAEGKN